MVGQSADGGPDLAPRFGIEAGGRLRVRCVRESETSRASVPTVHGSAIRSLSIRIASPMCPIAAGSVRRPSIGLHGGRVSCSPFSAERNVGKTMPTQRASSSTVRVATTSGGWGLVAQDAHLSPQRLDLPQRPHPGLDQERPPGPLMRMHPREDA